MPRYLISFDAHAMDHIPDEDVPAVADAAHAVVQQAMDAGVWVFGGGLADQKASIAAVGGTVTDGAYPEAAGAAWLAARAPLANVELVQPRCRRDVLPGAGTEVVHHVHLVSPREERIDEMRPDETRSAGDDRSHQPQIVGVRRPSVIST